MLGDRLAVGTSLFQAMDRDSLMSQPPTFSMRIEKAAIGVLASRPSPEVQRDVDFAKKALSRS